MKKKGFTLIELLAVIVILAVIALISVSIILNVVEKARKGTFEDSAYGVVDAARIYYASGYLDGNGNGETFIFPDDTKLKLSGTKPKSGSVKLEKDGKIAIAISNGKWCAVKDNNEEKVRITDYSVGDCEIGNVEKPDTPESCFTVKIHQK